MRTFKQLRQEYLSTLKSLDTEEHIDLYFYRPLGFCVAKVSEKLSITPNALTILSIFLGIGAGVAFYSCDLMTNAMGIGLLVCANMLDSADGQLARMTKQYSRIGRILDGMAGDLWFITIYFSLCFRETAHPTAFADCNWVVWAIAILAGASHIKQAQMADYYRQIHLRFMAGNTINELEDIDALQARYDTMAWKDGYWNKLVLKFYLGYCKQQTAIAPNMQKLGKLLNNKYPESIPTTFSAAFRKESLPLMKFTNILSFNWRSFTLFTALLIQLPWIYFVVELILFNLLLIYMCTRHERICAKFIQQLNTPHS